MGLRTGLGHGRAQFTEFGPGLGSIGTAGKLGDHTLQALDAGFAIGCSPIESTEF